MRLAGLSVVKEDSLFCPVAEEIREAPSMELFVEAIDRDMTDTVDLFWAK